MWKSFGIVPNVVLGHSVGEFAAAVAAGILTFDDGLKLVTTRSFLVNQLPNGAMLAVKADEEIVRRLINSYERENVGKWIDVAAINSSNQCVVSGETDAILEFEKFCNSQNQKVTLIAATHAFHSRSMDCCLDSFGAVAASIQIQRPNNPITFISSTKGKAMKVEEFNGSYWQDHLRHSVQFTAALETLSAQNMDMFIEIGAQPVLTPLAMTQLPNTNGKELTFCPSMRRNEENATTLLTTLAKLYVAGAEIDWLPWFGPTRTRRNVELPTYPFQRTKFW